MKLNHLDLQVRDVRETTAFFTRYFDLRLQSSPGSPAIAILTDDHGFVLVLQRRERDDETYPDGFHLGFLLDDVASVVALQSRARAGGADVTDVIVNGRGTMIYFTLPEGYRVEVACQRHVWATPAATHT